jgi:flagellar hook-associated protein 1 FlgK
MSSLLAALANGGNALRQFERAVTLTQTQVVNASTPGYAAQQLRFEAMPFAPESGLYGGVRVGAIESTRDEFAEAAVRRQASNLGYHAQSVITLSSVEASFDIGDDGGVPASMQKLFDAFGSWSQSPNDGNAREAVLAAAEEVAVAFRQSAAQLQSTVKSALEDAQTLTAKINEIANKVAEINQARRQSPDSISLDSEVYDTLEQLSEISNFTVIRGTDNTLTVLLGGQIPLVVGDHTYAVQALERPVSTPGSPSAIQVLDASGQDVTAVLDSGKLGGVINGVNQTIASLLGGDGSAGSLNDLATAFATRINTLLESGVTADGSGGLPLFEVAADGSAAATLKVADLSASDLAAISPGPPSSANGVAVKLAALSSPTDDADKIDGSPFLDYYARLSSQVGNLVTSARANETRFSQLASQARSLRSEISGVSLDEEAVRLVEFQRAYDATARTISTLNEMMDTLMNMVA